MKEKRAGSFSRGAREPRPVVFMRATMLHSVPCVCDPHPTGPAKFGPPPLNLDYMIVCILSWAHGENQVGPNLGSDTLLISLLASHIGSEVLCLGSWGRNSSCLVPSSACLPVRSAYLPSIGYQATTATRTLELGRTTAYR